MALGTTNITTAAVNTELGSPYTTPRVVRLLCIYSTQNKYSFYGTGAITTDGSKNIVWTAPSSDYKLGDFRSYNHSASTPVGATNFTWNWGPGGTTDTIVITCFPYEMNVLDADSNATYIRYNFYLSTSNRTTETSAHDNETDAANFSGITPLAGHTRTQSSKIQSTHVGDSITLTTTGLSTPNDFIYLDTFFSNISGTRLLNLGASVAGGYTTITAHESQPPTLDGGANVSPPSGWTTAFPIINTASTPVCTDVTQTNTNGDTTYDFYLCIRGVDGIVERTREVTSCTVQLKYSGSSYTIATSQALGYSSKTRLTGTIPSSQNFSYDEAWTVEVLSITYGANEGGPC